jgi:lipopolysaccharide biosynthesis regulator YciM
MAVGVEAHEDAAGRLVAGARAKGEYRCTDCGYGVTVYRELPTCPMCRSETWEQADWIPLGRTALPYEP